MYFQTLAGIYTYAMDHHTGQNSRLYRLMCKIDFQPGLHDVEVFDAIRTGDKSWEYGHWEDASRVYQRLKDRKAK